MIERVLMLILLLPLFLLIRRLVGWVRNYYIARRTGLPLIIVPFSWQDPLWLIFRRRSLWLRNLPLGSPNWMNYSYTGWALNDRYKTHARLGDAFAIVSPTMVVVMVADPKAATEVFSKYKTWQRPKLLYRVFDLFGPSVASVNGEDWQRHRKVAAKGFSEQNCELVWQSATKQARQMMDTMPEKVTLKEMNGKINTLAMHVLSYAGFGHDYDFDRGVKEVPAGHKKSFADAMTHLLLNLIIAFLITAFKVPETWMPAGWKDIKASERELKTYFKENLESGTQGDLVASIVEANAEAKKDSKSYLREDEMYGNLFLIQLAGFETTSSALQLALGRIGAMPELQDWVMEDVRSVGGYNDTFTTQVRCLAVMYETLRYYGTTPELVRYSPQDGTLQCGDRNIAIPAGVFVAANVPGVHYNPRFWGEDINEFKPSRWIEKTATGEEKLKDAPEGTVFIPWTIGPRVCPGKKFSQVEFVGAVLSILEKYRIEASKNTIDVLEVFDFRVGIYPRDVHKATLKFVKKAQTEPK